MNSKVISLVSARSRLLVWGIVMIAIYSVFLFFFPLYPKINQADHVSDIEMLLKHGREWVARYYVLGIAVLFFAYWRVLKIAHDFSKEQPESAKSLRMWVLGIGMVCALLLIGLYPITALDVVLYVVRARLWALYGGSPMSALPAHFPQDPFISLAGEYAKQPSPYGPVWELVAQIPLRLGITSIAGGVIAMKVISLLSYIGMALLIGWWARRDADKFQVSRITALTFFALNPLVLMQAIGNGHNDMLMLFCITLGLVLWQRERWIGATLALTIATLVKVTGFILLPLFGIAVLTASPNWRTRITRGLGMVAIFIAISLIAYRLTGPLPEVFEGARHAALGRFGYTPAYALHVLIREIVPSSKTLLELPEKLFLGIFVLYYVYVLIKLAQGKITLLEAGFATYFSQLILGSTFRIWYPMWLIPFAALNLNSRTYWRTFLFSITAELSILMYYILWRWYLRKWEWGTSGPLKEHWEYWLIMTWLTVPWTFGIPILGPVLRRRRDRQRFENTLWV